MRKISTGNTKKNDVSPAVEAESAVRLERLMPYMPDSSILTVLCRRSDYSARTLAHAVEDCDAHVLNLNVTSDAVGEDMIAVEVRVDRNNVDSIVRSLARYDYNVVHAESTDSQADADNRRRIAELLRYIEM